MIYQIIFLSKKFNRIELNREKGGHMDELVYLRNDEAVCSSLQVAEKFEKRHDNVMRSIEGLLKNEETHEMFKNSSYIEEQNNQRYPMYLMNRDGFSLLVMGFTGKKALDWKLQYIKAFNQMEKFIREKQTQTWIETRKAGKLTRKAETDTIKNLVEYAKGQGSQHADKLYMTYSKLANKMAGISKRDEATVMQLNNLSLMEHIILCVIDSGIIAGKHYKEIYQDCKKRQDNDGSRLIVAEYPKRKYYWNSGELKDSHYFHLLEKNKKYYGREKTFDQQYVHTEDSETHLVEFLKNLQKGAK